MLGVGYLNSIRKSWLPWMRCSATQEGEPLGHRLTGLFHKKKKPEPGLFHGSFSGWGRCHVQVPVPDKKKARKSCESFFAPNRKARAESHAIDATRHLYTLQYPAWNLSRLQMIHGSSNLALLCAPRKCVWSWPEGYRNFNRWEHPKHHAC